LAILFIYLLKTGLRLRARGVRGKSPFLQKPSSMSR